MVGDKKSMTSLCSTCTGVSANSVVSAVAGCLVFFRLQWVLFPVEKSFVRFAWAESPTSKPLTFSVTLTSDLFVTFKFGRLSPAHSCCQRVLGCRITASSGRPHIGRMPQSESKFVAQSGFFIKHGPVFKPSFLPRSRGRKWALSNLKEQPGVSAIF